MKKLTTLSTVIALHIAVISMMFIQPGCGSTSEENKPDAKSQASDAVNLSEPMEGDSVSANAPEADKLAEEQPEPALPEGSAGLRAAPTRPSGTWNMNGSGKVIVEESTPQNDAVSVQAPADTQPQEVQNKVPTLKLSVYKVQKGDSLWSIAKKHNVPFGEILKANGMTSNSKIKIGQEIQIPSITKTADNSAVSSATATDKPAEQKAAASNGKETVYVVKKGDSLSKIAVMHRVKVSQIKELNGLSSDMVRIGQKLKIPEGKKAAVVSVATSGGTQALAGEAIHTVSKGETLGAIAKKYGTSVSKIVSRNAIKDPRKIRVGQKIIVPSSSSSAAKKPAEVQTQQVKNQVATSPEKTATEVAKKPEQTTATQTQPNAATVIPDSATQNAAAVPQQIQEVETVEVINADQPTTSGTGAQEVKTEGGTEVIDL